VLGAQKTYDLIAGLIQKGFFVAHEQQSTFAFLRRRRASPDWAAGTWDARAAPASVGAANDRFC
jgi:hypothetical protein